MQFHIMVNAVKKSQNVIEITNIFSKEMTFKQNLISDYLRGNHFMLESSKYYKVSRYE